MRIPPRIKERRTLVGSRALILLCGVLLACTEGGNFQAPDLPQPGPPQPGPPHFGILEVTVTLTGSRPDPEGYRVLVGGASATHTQSVTATGGTVRFESLEPGAHLVQLQALRLNCGVEGDNPRDFSVVAEETTRINFVVVACSEFTNLADQMAGEWQVFRTRIFTSDRIMCGSGGWDALQAATLTSGGATQIHVALPENDALGPEPVVTGFLDQVSGHFSGQFVGVSGGGGHAAPTEMWDIVFSGTPQALVFSGLSWMRYDDPVDGAPCRVNFAIRGRQQSRTGTVSGAVFVNGSAELGVIVIPRDGATTTYGNR